MLSQKIANFFSALSDETRRYKKVGRKKLFHLSDEHVSHILNDVIVHLSPEGPCNGELNCSDEVDLHLVIE